MILVNLRDTREETSTYVWVAVSSLLNKFLLVTKGFKKPLCQTLKFYLDSSSMREPRSNTVSERFTQMLHQHLSFTYTSP